MMEHVPKWVTVALALVMVLAVIPIAQSNTQEENKAPIFEPSVGPQQGPPGVNEAFDLHLERVHAVAPETAGEVDSLLEQQQSNVELANELQAIESTDHVDALAQDFEGIAAATAWQATGLGTSLEVVEPHDHALPSEAALALAKRHDVDVSPEEHEELSALDDLPEPQRGALVDVFNGFLAYEDATQAAYEDADIEKLLEMNDGFALDASPMDALETLSKTEEVTMTDAGVDVGLILGTRTQFLEAVMDFHRAWEGFSMPTTTTSSSIVNWKLCPAFALDLSGVDDTYGTSSPHIVTEHCALVVDVGGDDTFYNNAGGSRLVGESSACIICPGDLDAWGAAALVNLEGNDDYVSEDNYGVNGGGYLGAGFLYDGGGSDEYWAGHFGTNGGGSAGVGFLYDHDGADDYYAGDRGTNGGGNGLIGTGFLYDGGGNDYFLGGRTGMNGGSSLGHGFLFSGGGHDRYATSGSRTIETTGIGTGGAGAGANGGGAVGGVGFLFDPGGDDTYISAADGSNGGGHLGGVGSLFDLQGDDTYKTWAHGTNGGGDLGGVGSLFDIQGSDTYTAGETYTEGDPTHGTNGGGHVGGIGSLFDFGGDDTYTAGGSEAVGLVESGINGGGFAGTGLLLDVSGVDRFEDNLYVCDNENTGDCTKAPKGAAGALIDSDPEGDRDYLLEYGDDVVKYVGEEVDYWRCWLRPHCDSGSISPSLPPLPEVDA